MRDGAENEAAAFSDRAVTNFTPDTAAPALETATVNGSALVLTYNEALDEGSEPAAGAYAVKLAGGAGVAPSAAAVSGRTVTLTLAAAAGHGQTVTLSYTVPTGTGAKPVRDGAENEAAAFSNRAVTNNTPDAAAPALETATVNGSALVLTYNEALDESSEPAAGAYTVKLAGGAGVAPSAAAVSGRTVTLTLATAAGHGQAVTLSYTVPTGTDAKPVRDGAENEAAAFSDRAVTNNTPDTAAPALETATVNGSALVLTYNEALDEGSEPAAGAYAVKLAGGAGVAPSAAAVSGRTVTLTLAAAAGHGQTVTLSYTVPTGTDAKPVRDGAENEAAAFSNRAVTNNTPDTAAPALETATVNGTALVLTYNEALDEGSEPAAGAYAVKLAGAAGVAPSAAAVSGRTVTLTLAAAAGHGQTVTLSYTVPTGTDAKPVRDGAENEAAAFSDRAVTNNTPDTAAPALETATVNGASLVLTYHEALDEGSEPAAGAYAVKLAGGAGVAPSAAAVSGRTVTLTLAAAAGHGQTVTLSYTVPTGTDAKPVRDGAENEAAAFSDRAVTNNTPDTAAPALATATVNGSALVLTYNEALDEGSEPAAGAYAVKLAGGAGVAPSAAAVSGRTVTLTLAAAAGHGQTVTLSYTVPTGTDAKPVRDGAENEAAAFSDRAVTNNTPDTAAPALETATVNGSALVLTYNEALDESSEPAAGAYAVKLAGGAGVAPSAAAVSGRTVILTLAAAAGYGQAVTLSYTVPTGTDAKPVRDGAENEAAAFSDRAVTNNTPDTAAPALETATVNGSALVLTYNEALDEGSEPAAGAYAVKLAGGAGVAPSAAAVSGRTVTLTLAAAAGHGQAVTLSYTVPTGTDAKPVRDGAENEAAAFSDRAVTNNTPDTAAPALETATVNGSALVLTYNEALDEGSEPAAGAYAVKLAGAAGVAPSAAAVSGRTVTLTLATAAGHGQTVTLSYTVPTGTDAKPVRDGAENEAAAFSNRGVTNFTPDAAAPALATATVDGSALVLTYNEALDEGSEPAAGAYAVKLAGGAGVAPSSAAVSGRTVTLTLAAAAGYGQTVTLSYTVPTGTDAKPVRDGAENEAAAFSDRTVTNNTPAAMEVMEDMEEPLTVAFEREPPEEHDGTAFTFRIAFSEELASDYSDTTMRDASLSIYQGATRLIPSVLRLDPPGNRRWEVTVTPEGNGDITVSLGPTGACTESGAMCTGNGRPLADRLHKQIQGPVTLSVADATVQEAPGATLDFAVSLSRVASGPVTVKCATSAGTATAGLDYTEMTGTLTFAQGETEKTIGVTVLDDARVEGDETLTLTLSNPSGAVIAGDTATGTIENTDTMPQVQAWLARFGRTVAEQVVDAVQARLTAAPVAGVEAVLAGQRIGGPGSVSVAAEPGGEARLEALSDWLRGAADDEDADRFGSRAVSERDLLTGTSFALAAETDGGAFAALWGQGAITRFDGREGDLTLDGEVQSATVGADWTQGRATVGLAVSHSRAGGSYRGAGAGAGAVESTLTGVYPYGRYALNERVTLWGVAGYGAGSLTLTPKAENGDPVPVPAPMKTDMDLAMGAVGLRGVVVEAPAEGGLELAAKTDALLVRMSSQKAAGLEAAQADVTRLRVGLEGTWRGIETGGGGALTPAVEVGIRRDGGDAETGFGVDVGGRVAWSDPRSGISAEVSARGLLTREADGFRERGFAGSLAWDPRPGSERGLSLTLTQTVGAQASGGMDALLGRGTLEGLAANDDGDALGRRQLALRLGYGIAAFGDRFTATPEVGLGLSDTHREYSLGWRLGLARSGAAAFELGLTGTRRESANDDAGSPEHALALRNTLRW